MKAFIKKIFLFSTLLVGCLTLSLFFITDPNTERSILGAIKDKHQLLETIRVPKIIFIGGSNLSFGLNSQLIKEKFDMPVVNMGLNAGLGLRFMLSDIKDYIHRGDVVVITPEYQCFYSDNFYGEMELVSTLFDVVPEEKQLINSKQWVHLSTYLPTYSAKKIKTALTSLFSKKTAIPTFDVYNRYSFNKYGDAHLHWYLPNQDFLIAQPYAKTPTINSDVIPFLKEFKDYVIHQRAQLLILPPVIEKQSFDNIESSINMINLSLQENDLPFFCEPKMYVYHKKYFFNSYYHLSKNGVDLRTYQVIENLNNFLKPYEEK